MRQYMDPPPPPRKKKKRQTTVYNILCHKLKTQQHDPLENPWRNLLLQKGEQTQL